VGIRNIKSRVNLYQGTVAILSNPGDGYQLKVVLSLKSYMDKPVLSKGMRHINETEPVIT